MHRGRRNSAPILVYFHILSEKFILFEEIVESL